MIGKTTHNDEKENSAGGDDDNSCQRLSQSSQC